MRIKMLTIMAGPEHAADAGAVIEVPDKLGKELIRTGHATAAPEAPARKSPERATRQAPEHRDEAAKPPIKAPGTQEKTEAAPTERLV